MIYHAGDIAHAFGLVLSGRVQVENDDFWGNKSVLASIEAGDTFAETYARNAGKEVLRLDSQKVNDDLSRYYEALGYPAVGECIDGAYVGIKREKPLNG